MASESLPVIQVASVTHHYGKTCALDDLSVEVPAGRMVGLIGPDGVGKSTLMGLIAGAKIIQAGDVNVLGGDMRDPQHRNTTCPRIAYMPQGLGKNLYAELSVFENLEFFGRLFSQRSQERRARIDALVRATGLDPFVDRPAGKLSGGMKQKLGLCCALIHDPDLLLLDEPTTGVDPLSRQQFWTLIDDIRADRPTMSVLVSTAYMDEANRFAWLIAMNDGRVLATGSPTEMKERTNSPSLEEAYVQLLPENRRGGGKQLEIPPHEPSHEEPAIVAQGLTRRFGDFVAVNDVSFSIDRGEIFGFLGSNGCGKTTTMKMLTGLIPASEGTARLFGEPIAEESLVTRQRVGYMSQSFSLYGELTVQQNLWLHARLFHLPRHDREPRIEQLLKQFDLERHVDDLASELPLGVRQRLSLAVAIIHTPDMLILDEPTSGVDPVARDEFWELLVDLSRNQNVTIFISTHFMNEALRCDRISLMHAGNVLACDEPRKLIATRGAADLEEAFIGYIADAIPQTEGDLAAPSSLLPAWDTTSGAASQKMSRWKVGLAPLLAYSIREALEIRRDPVRLAFGFLGSMVLMFVFGFGITMDVNQINFAVLDMNQTPESREYLSEFAGSRYFRQMPPILTQQEMERRLKNNEISLAVEIPANFGREVKREGKTTVAAWIDGSSPARAATIEGYVQGVHAAYLRRRASENGVAIAVQPIVQIEDRYRYNPTFESIYAMVPSVPAILLVLIPAILMAVSVVKEKELGSITNFYVTPTSRLEFLLGKQIPYIVIGMLNYALLTLMAIYVFQVPLKGSGWMLTACALAYVTSITGIGLLISAFTSSQVAAVFVTTVITILPTVQFSGMMQPVSTLEGGAYWMGRFWPTAYYMHASVGAFTKGLSAREMLNDLLALLAFIPVLTFLTVLTLRKQER
jgi:ribosome-dependent ATPase